MKPPAFDYVRADGAASAAELLQRHGDGARILAGGQSLMAVLNMRLAQPALLIDISRSAELASIALEPGALRVGAAVTQAQLQDHPDVPPLLALAIPHISHVQIRNRGTVCGSIAHADPSAELPLCLVALQGTVHLRSASAFFTGLLSTARRADELIEAVSFPRPAAGQSFGFAEHARRHGDFALCAVAVIAHAQGMRVAVGGLGDRPHAVELPPLADDALDDALNELAWSFDVRDDAHASAATRRHLLRRLARQAIQQARRPA
jgi:2-furoyl-CoA dehydrogenase FAD binding subunit